MTDETPSEEQARSQNPASAIYGEDTGFRGRTSDPQPDLPSPPPGQEGGIVGEVTDYDHPTDQDASPGYVPTDSSES
jgi:hypothetical protein